MGEGILDYLSGPSVITRVLVARGRVLAEDPRRERRRQCEANQRDLEILHSWLEDERRGPKSRNSGAFGNWERQETILPKASKNAPAQLTP